MRSSSRSFRLAVLSPSIEPALGPLLTNAIPGIQLGEAQLNLRNVPGFVLPVSGNCFSANMTWIAWLVERGLV